MNQEVNENYQWFIDNYSSLFEQYGPCALVIKHQCVVGVYDNFNDAVDKAFKLYNPGEFSIQGVSGPSGPRKYHNYYQIAK